MDNREPTAPGSESHHTLIVPLVDGYAVSCSCGWLGGSHDTAEEAEAAAREHEIGPSSTEGVVSGRP